MSKLGFGQNNKRYGLMKLVFVLSFATLVGIALFAHFLRTSSSSSISFTYQSIASLNRAVEKHAVNIVASDSQDHQKEGSEHKNGSVEGRVLSATFADLPAPELEWEQMPSAPVPRLDGYSVQIKNLFYVFVGYRNLDHVHSHVDVYNFSDNTWCDRFDTPKDMANSHLGVATDGRYVYIVSGQNGTQCRTAITTCFSLDIETRKWHRLPPLPAPRLTDSIVTLLRNANLSSFSRHFLAIDSVLEFLKDGWYAPATQLWRGRLHVMGGSKENRHTPGLDHWSIAVKNGKALDEWRTETPIPRGGPHRACVVVDDRLLVIGGQEGDFMAKPGSPIFKCSRRKEVVYGDVYMLDGEMKWKTLPEMPKPDSHIECAWVIVNNSIIITGGTTEKHPNTKRMMLVGEVFQFHLDSQTWSVIGKLPFRIKTTLAGFWDGWLYFTSGQRDRGPDNPQPRKVIGEMWRTKLHL